MKENIDFIEEDENLKSHVSIKDDFGSQWEVMQDPEHYEEDILTDFNVNKVTIANPKLLQNSDLKTATAHVQPAYTIPLNISEYGDGGHWAATVDYVRNEGDDEYEVEQEEWRDDDYINADDEENTFYNIYPEYPDDKLEEIFCRRNNKE